MDGPHNLFIDALYSLAGLCSRISSMLDNTFSYSRDNVNVVVAKYKEDVGWARHPNVSWLIYDKDKNIPNLGRESDTYLGYIINHYDRLPAYTLFLQGCPFDHCEGVFPQNVARKIMEFPYADRFQPFYPLQIWKDSMVIKVSYKGSHMTSFDMSDFFHAWFPNSQVTHVYFPPGAQFMVPKEAVLFRPIEFYRSLRETVQEIDPIEGHFLERMWPTIFDGKTPNVYTRDIKFI